MLHFISHPDYDIPLPQGHRFPAYKFTQLIDRVIRAGLLKDGRISHPRPAERSFLEKVHASSYIDAILADGLTGDQLRQLGLPWSERLARRSMLAVEGTYKSACKALQFGLACHGAGGTHHAHYGHGAGFCVFNDMAYTARRLVDEGKASKVLILDLDVHQGDGTAKIVSGMDDIFSCSIHCRENYPHEKAMSDWDIELDQGLGDQAYLKILNQTLEELIIKVKPDLVIYDAGVDVHAQDALGRLSLSDAGILARDNRVLEFWLGHGIPVVTVIGGGYMPDFDHLMQLHMMVFRAARDQFKIWC